MNDEVIKKVLLFRDERNWKQFHNTKDLAISLVLEATELLENFQWISSEEGELKNIENISDELADVLVYCIFIADKMNLDINKIIENKLIKNKEKYPVEKAFGKHDKYTEL